MMRIAALNDSSSESSNDEEVGPSQEALEADATRMYHKAIRHVAKGQTEEARGSFFDVLNNPYIAKAGWTNGIEKTGSLPQDIALKYSCYKNLGNLFMKEKLYDEALDFYLKAVHLDSTEVTLWQKLGASAIKIKDFQLAAISFQEGLLINPNHWPCADQLLSVLFLLGLYDDCLALSIETLKRDPNYIKALAFKDKIFEFQPSLKSFAKEYFKGSEVLFQDISYDQVKGEKFVATCLELRPPQKERKASPPPVSSKFSKPLNKFNWANLADVLVHTYDELAGGDSQSFVAKIELDPVIRVYVDQKIKTAIKENLKIDMNVFKPGRRLSRSLSYNDDCLSKPKVPDITTLKGLKAATNAENLASEKPTKDSPPKRRQTIELGEGQESFRVGSRRSSAESEIQEIVEEKMDVEESVPPKNDPEHAKDVKKVNETTESCEKVNTNCKEESKENNQTGSDKQSKGEETKAEIEPTLPTVTEGELPEEEEKREEEMEETPVVDEELMTGETQAAVDQLKDIMALKPPTQILNLSHTQFEYDQDYEYFDGGVYEEDEEEEEDEDEEEEDEMEVEIISGDNSQSQEGRNHRETSPEIEILMPGVDYQRGSGKFSSNRRSEKPDPLITSGNEKEVSGTNASQETLKEQSSSQVGEVCQSSRRKMESSADAAGAAQPAEPTPKPPPKKPKRPKRGLERELEQLDYWGRQKAREAKTRRRTLTSRLVGVFAFEENECLTWAHLIRSFIPAALLNLETSTNNRKESTTTDVLNVTASEKEKETSNLDDQKEKNTRNEEGESDKSEKESLKEQGQENVSVKGAKCQFYKILEEYNGLLDASHFGTEELEVGEFLYNMKKNGGILPIMQHCLNLLIEKYEEFWPLNNALAFKEIYSRIRKNITVGATLSCTEDPEMLHQFALPALTNLELLLSLHNHSSPNSVESPSELEQLLSDDSLYWEDDLFHLQLLLGRPDVWKDAYLQVHFRLAWIQSQIKIIQGNPEESAIYLQMLIDQMRVSTREDDQPIKIKRCRIENDTTQLALPFLQNQLNILQRSQMLERVEAKFDAGHYEEVVQILTSVLDDPKSKAGTEASCPSRHSQFLILVESLAKVGDVKGIIEWGSVCLKEAVEKFQSFEMTDEEGKKWGETIRSLLLLMLNCISSRASEVSETSTEHLVNLINCLVNILVIQLEQGAGLPQPIFNTLASWMILHYALSQYERSQAKKNQENEGAVSKGGGTKTASDSQLQEVGGDAGKAKEKSVAPFPSTLLLLTAHDELGKNNWCCMEEGTFLLYMLDVLMAEFENPLSDDQKLLLHQSVEQIMFCLFSHPSRKTKYKHLRDHGGQSIPLTWSRALQLYRYYLPPQLPEFQSSQVPSITDDVAVLFRRILSLMPKDFKHSNQTKNVELYIEGDLPAQDLIPLDFPHEIKDCYYLLADNYFKGKEWEQAIYYYKLDASVNPNRIDSWAPMGLAKKAQLETLLNSCEVIRSEEEFFKEAQRATKCLDRCLLLDQYFSNLWVEKGGLVYMIHSHASRLLKQDLNPDMSIEMFESLEKIKADMLKEASRCFCEASKIVEEGYEDVDLPDERWLYQYMLGKLAEKTSLPPAEAVGHYMDAMKRLHSIGAKYPPKINYNNTPDYSVESLEIYFRIHVFIFKYLTQRGGKEVKESALNLFKDIVERLAASPFVLMSEKGKGDSLVFEVDYQNLLEEEQEMEEVSSKRPLTEESECAPSSKRPKKDVDTKTFIENLIYEVADDAVKISSGKVKEKENESQDSKAKKKTGDSECVETNLNKEREELIFQCIDAFKLCVSRFPHHYKSLYQIAYFFHTSKTLKDNIKARNILLGCDSWQHLNYMPCNGLFSERKISSMNPKHSNFFHGVWRIPHDEIDRPGSFAAHMYRCVSLCLDILQETKDFYTVLEIALSLRNSPDKDKKYLRDNERELLSEHAIQVGIQTMKDKFRFLFKCTPSSTTSTNTTTVTSGSCTPNNSTRHAFIVDVYKAYKQNRFFSNSETLFSKMLVDSYACFKGLNKDSPNLLRDAENFCIRNPATNQNPTVTTAHSGTAMTSSFTPAHVGRRGRPPSYIKEYAPLRFQPSHDSKPTLGQTVAVQQAYKVYENLIQAQTILKNQGLDERTLRFYQGKYEEYKQQMLKYLQIQSVSQFFHSSLQSIGTSTAKLPPPPPNPSVKVAKRSAANENSLPTPTTHGKHSLSSLAARSKAHGISISAVSKKIEPPTMKPVKPSMSITLSPSKGSICTSSSLISNEVSVVSISKEVNINKVSSKSNTTDGTAQSNSGLPKLPPGTTLRRQVDASSSAPKPPSAPALAKQPEASSSSSSTQKLPPGTTLSKHKEPPATSPPKVPPTKDAEPVKKSSSLSIKNIPSLGTKSGVTITQASKPQNSLAAKKQSTNSFQAAFQASLAKSKMNNVSITNAKDPSSSRSLKEGIKISTLKNLKIGDKRWENLGKTLTSSKPVERPSKSSSPSKGQSVSSVASEKSESKDKKEDDSFVITLD